MYGSSLCAIVRKRENRLKLTTVLVSHFFNSTVACKVRYIRGKIHERTEKTVRYNRKYVISEYVISRVSIYAFDRNFCRGLSDQYPGYVITGLYCMLF